MSGTVGSRALKQILCATDFSDNAAAALESALALARPWNAAIHLLHVFPDRPPAGHARDSRIPRLNEKIQAELLDRLERSLQPAAGAGLETHRVLREGDASQEIVREAEHEPADLIAMGRHSLGGPDRWILGSVTEGVVRKASCPVMVVGPSRCSGQWPRRVLCALDLGKTSAATLAYATGLANTLNADLLALHVVPPSGAVPRAPDPRSALAALVDGVPAGGRPVREAVAAGEPFEHILDAGRENGIDLVVVGSHAGGVVDRPFLGSTTLHLLRRAERAVIVVPAEARRARQPEPLVSDVRDADTLRRVCARLS
jgi:nucleotide-binding universal stress UspA family protein